MLGNPLLLTLSFDSCRTKRFNQIQIIITTTYVGSSDLVISFIWYYSVRLLKACNHVQTGTRLVSLSVQLVTKQPKSCFVLWILLTEHFWSRDKTLLKVFSIVLTIIGFQASSDRGFKDASMFWMSLQWRLLYPKLKRIWTSFNLYILFIWGPEYRVPHCISDEPNLNQPTAKQVRSKRHIIKPKW